ncbi:hypothetical protein B9Z19DRAFT_1119003 [Tuber borchii]|uniref:HTH psq-type domain-containing protein n=1 Tax=Tuber borchii TaxID=42251 RepID=A0A2T7A758_TUBBO|nr:hypothetical protein B9Z19DRAFT_1119003 [Tuber borchii]
MLLERNDVNPNQSLFGLTPLLSASDEGHEGIVKMLLERTEVNPNKGRLGVTPLISASEKGHEGVVKMLLERNDREDPIAQAIQSLEIGKCSSLSKAVVAFDIPKSTLGHRMNGHQRWQKAHEGDQILSPAAEKAIVQWILKLEPHGFPARLDRVWQMAES